MRRRTLYTDHGTACVGKPEEFGQRKREEYTANVYDVPDGDACVTWSEGNEFEAARKQMLKAGSR